MRTYDTTDIRARASHAESLDYEILHDLLALTSYVDQMRVDVPRYGHALEHLADQLAEDGEAAYANALLTVARQMFGDLYPQSSHEPTAARMVLRGGARV